MIVVVVGAMLLGFSYWIEKNFGVITIDQALINLQGAGGEGAGGSGLIVSAVMYGVVIPLVFCALIFLGIRYLRLHEWAKSRGKVTRMGIPVLVGVFVLSVPVVGATAFSRQVSLDVYIRAMRSDLDLIDYYVEPQIASVPEGKQLNLVVIYLESVEDALADDSIFEEDMLAPLERATEGWVSVTIPQPANGGWTLGGIVNTQCGFPLRMVDATIQGDDLNETGETVDTYLSGATCLGDVLSDQGYTNVFMGGANNSFAGKGTFLASHGYDELWGHEEWAAQGETEFRDWGLSDRRLMELAKDKVTELHDSGEPFNLTLLTLDSHPSDWEQPYCDITTDIELTSIYRCSMEQVEGFVDYMADQGYLDDTAVVLMGDHRRMLGENDAFHPLLSGMETRYPYNRMWVPGGIDLAVDSMDQFSMYPTILELLGIDLVDGRAGIGVSALTAVTDRESTRYLPHDFFDSLVQSRSQDFYEMVWGVTDSWGLQQYDDVVQQIPIRYPAR